MNFDLVIQNGTIVTAEKTIQADLGIRDGKIAAIGQNLRGRETFPARDRLVIPGGVDPHVHLQMPTATTVTSDDWASGSRAAAYGGTTTVIDFVEPEGGQTLLEALALRQAEADGQAHVDYNLHMTLTRADAETLAQIPAVIAAGVPSFKLYTTYEGFALGDDDLIAAFGAVGAAGGLVLVHSENDSIVRHSLAALRAQGKLAPQNHPQSRPALAEVEAIQRVILLARFANVPLYVVHISTERGSLAVERARIHGQAVYGETCPQYLLLDENHSRAADPRESVKYICAPPLRQVRDQNALWNRLRNGGLQTVGTDHCAFNVAGQKEHGCDDFTQSPGGLPGIQARMALVHHFGVRAGWLTPEQWVSVCCAAPAQIFGLYPRKGSLEIGADADVVVFDPARRVRITQSLLRERVDYTPYEGLAVQGWVQATFLGGQLIASADDPAEVTRPARGQFIPARLG
jgi:dihydropyrimidinase